MVEPTSGLLEYLLPLTRLSEDRTVVLYDQLDCGESDKPGDPRNWTVDRFVAEVDALAKGDASGRVQR